jgi:hypothetical protein
MIKWEFLSPRNMLVIGLIALAVRFAFYKAFSALNANTISSTD